MFRALPLSALVALALSLSSAPLQAAEPPAKVIGAYYPGGSADANNGLYQPYSAPADAGDWRRIRAELLGKPGWQRH